MKGYLILWLITAVILTAIPPALLPRDDGQAATPSVTAPVQEQLSVQHTDSEQTSTMALDTLARYETMALIAPDAPLEAIKAMAVAVYTSFCYQYEQKATVTSTALTFPAGYTDAYWQEQWGEAYTANAAVFDEAFRVVGGQRLMYDGEPIMAVTHAMNSGATEEGTVLFGGDIPYLKSVASAADALDVGQLTTVTMSIADAKGVLGAICETVAEDASTWFGDATKTAAGTVTAMTVCGQTLTGTQLQNAFALRSAAFEVDVQDDSVIFTVHGSGHFVGMSVCGAVGMAEDGQTYDTIVKHYYTGIDIA